MTSATCCVLTYAGNECTNRPMQGLPCCWDHVSHWATASFDNLRRFLTPRANQVGRVYTDPHGRVAVSVRKQVGAPAEPRDRWWDEYGFTGLHLDVDTATVCADLLASLGNTKAAEVILNVIKRCPARRS